jgi:hypothetical protein
MEGRNQGFSISSLQYELDTLNGQMRELCKSFGQNHGPSRRVNSAKEDHTLITSSSRQMACAIPSMRKEDEPTVERPKFSNYTAWPHRANASIRLFRPHKLDFPQYKSGRKIFPVLKGVPSAIEMSHQ